MSVTITPFFLKLLTRDMALAKAAYVALGFDVTGQDGVFLRLNWPGGGQVVLVPQPAGVAGPAVRGTGVLVCFASVDDHLDALATRAADAGLKTEGPSLQPWGTLELVVVDPDGYRLNFLAPGR